MFKLKIRKFRLKEHMSQEQLGLKCELSQNYISLLEKGVLRTKSPRLKTLHVLCKGLNCCLYDLVICDCEKCKQKRKEDLGE
ncbi:helix-turn-helix transcriptional regulator [Clostridium botulinum]|uniref:helix-turn-helix transcriptional regulator n=1 Tax=Clostridium botulinum TaxID=1491 RepID=UPI001C9A6430|nr:helix-turn-helix transcriptional regulator [Clostridium botulinum]MBY6838758.1 helix-turn-helix transcriptional regulator [Clostridium botulinum]